jgi:hypothetical protein
MNQDLSQDRYYFSESQQRQEEIKRMPVPYAARCLGKLEKDIGPAIHETNLGKALLRRVHQGMDAETTDVDAIGGGKMLRGPGGKFSGAYAKSRPKRKPTV